MRGQSFYPGYGLTLTCRHGSGVTSIMLAWKILKAFRNSFPDTAAWKAGYEPMLKELEAGGGHTAVEKQVRGRSGKSSQRAVFLQTTRFYQL